MARRSRMAALALAALAHAGGASGEEGSFVQAGTAPPPGFEDLAGPQVTEVDVYYAGRLLTATLARYDLTGIEFLEPADVVGRIERLLDPGAVAGALSGPLPHNADRLCTHPAQTDCGELTPPVAAVIFDESRFRVTVFVNPLQVEARPVHLSRHLPPSSSDEWSTLHRVSLSLAGGGGADDANAAATTLVARGASRLLGRYDVGNEGFSLSELSWQRDHAGWEFEAGLFRSFGRSVAFVDEQDIVGARAGRSLNTRADLDTAQGTPVFVFLNQRSRVDVLRDGRLLDSRFYEGGSQQLDTSRLPDGAYLIELRIRGADGRERSESVFFVRSAQLPPADQPLYFVEAGAVADTADRAMPALPGAAWARGGVAWRVRDDLALELSTLHAGPSTLAEAGAFFFGPGWQMHGSVMASTDGDAGLALFGRLGIGEATVGVDVRQVRASGPADEDFDPLAKDFTQASLTVSAPLAAGRFSLRARHDRRGDEAAVSGFGLSWARPVYRRRALTLDLEVDASSQADDRLLRLGLQARWRGERRFTSVRPGIETRRDATGGDTEMLLDARTTLQSEGASLGRMTSTAFALREVERSLVGAGISSESRLGRASAEAEYVNDAHGSHVAYSANARFGVVAGRSGAAVGGSRGELAAIVVDIDGAGEDARFDVLIDDHLAGEAHAGRRTIIGLRPYDTYRVRLRPRGETLIQLDQRPREVTLYPGNVETLRYAPRVITVLVGQAIWADGSPVANARFENVEGLGVTDGNGWFQVEVTGREPLHLDARDRGHCRIELPDFQAEQGLAVLEPLACEPIPAPP